ncbi:MAG: hypothetical protein HRU18_11120 [Pseudoalteromonas sp.]|uniref:XkdF-like putative serine protease domain-containing protein n=1 Tax=Pseudoalteromonas sp. TaxID=53249 RepID=UPI001DF5E13D|nr:XkdF-like putative serine protease domain-containing protein [Pseudoalteromonas sp.]NRA78750.1 hypothetical protein [Pseudoalteromonas sp.]
MGKKNSYLTESNSGVAGERIEADSFEEAQSKCPDGYKVLGEFVCEVESDEIDVIELFIDEDSEDSGVEAISLVEYPAIEENFVALSKHKVEFKAVDSDKRIVVGYALIPDKKIYRKRGDYEYNILFSKETVQKASELYLKRLKNNNTTLEHESFTSGVSVVESWVTEDLEKDKINLYGVDPILGGWAVKMKVYNDKVWQEVKEGKYMGFSIEGSNFTSEKQNLSSQSEEEKLLDKIEKLLKQGND